MCCRCLMLKIIGLDLQHARQTLGFRKLSIENCSSQHPFLGHGDLQDQSIFLLALDLGSRLHGVLAKQ